MTDHTNQMEADVLKERKPRLFHLFKLFFVVFSSTKLVSTIYLGAFILLSLLRPAAAFIWERYISGVEASTQGKLLAPILLLLLYLLLNFLSDLISRYVYLMDDIEQLSIVQAHRQQEKLQGIMYRKLASTDPEFFEIPKLQDKIAQVFQFAGNRFGLNTGVMLQCYLFIAKFISLVSIALTLFFFDPWLCLILLIAPLPTIWVQTVGGKMKFAFMKNNTKLLRAAEYFQNLMISPVSKELKVLNLHDFFYQKWKAAADKYFLNEQKLIRDQAKFRISHDLILTLTSVMGSIFAMLRMAAGVLTIAELSSVLLLVSTLVNDMKEMLTSFATLVTKKNEAAQFFDLMELGNLERKNSCPPISVLELHDLKYRYPLTDRYVIDNINLKIRKGEKIAFAGENGAGKTTLIKLITGLLTPSEGAVLIDGQDAMLMNRDSLFDRFGQVMQNPSRYYTFTVAENVYLGDTAREENLDLLEKSLNFAELTDIQTDTLLGKTLGGTDISGGQWQKLAIARADYRNRDFLILDEPTGNLDPIAETKILQKYLELAQDKTVIYVTHRISAAALADRIIVFEKGKIVQDGTHEELMRAGGCYARLYQAQAKWYD